MLCMIREVLAGLGMGEDRQALAVQCRPLGKVAELPGRHRQLAAATWVRPDRTQVEMPDWSPEPRLRLRRQRLRRGKLVRVEIDVRMKVADAGHGGDVATARVLCNPAVWRIEPGCAKQVR